MTQEAITPQMLLEPVVMMLGRSESTKASEGMAGIVRRQELLRRNIRFVLAIAEREITEDGRSIFNILEGAYSPLNSGWSLIGRDGQIIKNFAKKVANLIFHGYLESTGAANDSIMPAIETEVITGRMAA